MGNLSLTNFITFQVQAQGAGLNPFNTGNVLLLTRENPVSGTFDPAGNGYQPYVTAAQVATDFGSPSVTAGMAAAFFAQQPNVLNTGGQLIVIRFLNNSESVQQALVRTAGLVNWFGLLVAEVSNDADILTAAAYVQGLQAMYFVPGNEVPDIQPGGILDQLRTGGFTQSRALFYGSVDDQSCLNFAAAYASRLLSVNYSGSQTCLTMQGKSLATIQPDPSGSQANLGLAQAAGADTYMSYGYSAGAGVAKVFSVNPNGGFADEISNELAFLNYLQIAFFNAVAQTGTKIPQTEAGIDVFRQQFRQICDQFVTNGYLAPGTWTSVDTFGNPQDLIRNITERGYYIFIPPLSLQLATDRAARKMPVAQIAVKEAGAVHTGNGLVTINP